MKQWLEALEYLEKSTLLHALGGSPRTSEEGKIWADLSFAARAGAIEAKLIPAQPVMQTLLASSSPEYPDPEEALHETQTCSTEFDTQTDPEQDFQGGV